MEYSINNHDLEQKIQHYLADRKRCSAGNLSKYLQEAVSLLEPVVTELEQKGIISILKKSCNSSCSTCISKCSSSALDSADILILNENRSLL